MWPQSRSVSPRSRTVSPRSRTVSPRSPHIIVLKKLSVQLCIDIAIDVCVTCTFAADVIVRVRLCLHFDDWSNVDVALRLRTRLVIAEVVVVVVLVHGDADIVRG